MQYTFEITVAGCSTKCKHCYVSGGPAKCMELDDFYHCLSVLKPALAQLNGSVAVTLGNEPFLHPNAWDVLSAAYEAVPEYFLNEQFDYPTTGIALASRHDTKSIFELLSQMNYHKVMLTIHGNQLHHNEITGNPFAFQGTLRAAELFNQNGFSLECNLMLNRYLITDWDDVLHTLDTMHCTHAHLTVPLYLPVQRLRDFQPLRPQLEDCLPLLNCMGHFGLDSEAFYQTLSKNCEQALWQNQNWDYRKMDEQQPQWAFFHVDQNLDFYYGNVGQHIRFLCNLRQIDSDTLYQMIAGLPANYNYSAYYELCSLPAFSTLKEHLSPLNTNYVYPDAESCLYRWLDLARVPSILI